MQEGGGETSGLSATLLKPESIAKAKLAPQMTFSHCQS